MAPSPTHEDAGKGAEVEARLGEVTDAAEQPRCEAREALCTRPGHRECWAQTRTGLRRLLRGSRGPGGTWTQWNAGHRDSRSLRRRRTVRSSVHGAVGPTGTRGRASEEKATGGSVLPRSRPGPNSPQESQTRAAAHKVSWQTGCRKAHPQRVEPHPGWKVPGEVTALT